jgi:hypothetical protein
VIQVQFPVGVAVVDKGRWTCRAAPELAQCLNEMPFQLPAYVPDRDRALAMAAATEWGGIILTPVTAPVYTDLDVVE